MPSYVCLQSNTGSMKIPEQIAEALTFEVPSRIQAISIPSAITFQLQHRCNERCNTMQTVQSWIPKLLHESLPLE